MDVGKFLYERQKKEKEARKQQVKIEIKEIRLRPKTTPIIVLSKFEMPVGGWKKAKK